MAEHPRFRHLLWLAAGVVAASSVSSAQSSQSPPPAQGQPPQNAQVFRGRTLLVPVDVRVLDREGKPVTDLSQQDFTILENGVPQKISHFHTQALEPRAVDPKTPATRWVERTGTT